MYENDLTDQDSPRKADTQLRAYEVLQTHE